MSVVYFLMFVLLAAYCILILHYAKTYSQTQFIEASKDFVPEVSILLPVRNESDTILETIKYIEKQEYPKDNYELIIIDDQSTDNTVEVIKNHIVSSTIQTQLIIIDSNSKSFGKKAAIQAGIKNAKYDLIITTDADVIVSPNWIKSIIVPFSDEKVNMSLGKVEVKYDKPWLHAFQHIEFATLIGLTGACANKNNPLLCNGANLAYRKQIYKALADYNIEKEGLSGDDVFLMQKIHEKYPGSVVFNSYSCVITDAKSTWKELLQQRARWISKIGRYKSNKASQLGLFIFLVNLSLLLLFLNTLFFFHVFKFLWFIIIKAAVDYLLIRKVTSSLSPIQLFWNVLKYEIVYAYYLLRIVTFNKNKLEWKGRKL